MRTLSGLRKLALAATAAAIIGAVAAAPAVAQSDWGGAYHHGYTDHQWGYGGYYDGYVGSYGAYNDTPAWQRGYDPYYPAYAPDYYTYGYYPPYGDYDYPYDYPPAPGVGVRVGPVGIGVFP